MAAPNEKVGRTYETIDINTLHVVNKRPTHLICLCPECKNKLDKPDLKGKLYFSIKKKVGLCFRCNTVFYPIEDEEDKNNNKDIRDLQNNIEKYLNKNSIVDDEDTFSPVALKFEKLNRTLLEYLNNRNPLILSILDMLGLGGWYGKDTGVVTPFIYNGNVIKFQVRYITREKGDNEYYTMPGPKYLYSPFHTSTKLFTERTISICEGTYDAIALAIMGYPNPLAILGKCITQVQLSQIRKMVPYNCWILLDEKKLGYGILKQLKSEIGSISEYIVSDFNGPDPEEYLRYKIKTDSKFKESCIENIIKWRSGQLIEV